MPNYYIINLSRQQARISPKEDATSYFTVKITSRRNIGIKEGDYSILMRVSNRKTYVFTEIGIIRNIESDFTLLKQQSGEDSIFTLSLEITQELTPPLELNSVAFSLQKIYKHFNAPYRHLNRAYSIISRGDFTTISNGEIFYARTAFGMIVNKLHIQHRINFINYFIDTNAIVYFNKINYEIALTTLNSYINSHIIIPARYLAEAYRNLQAMPEVISQDNLNRISFGMSNLDDAGRPIKRDNISSQVEIINNFFSKESNELVISSSQVIATSNQLENQNRFEALFNRSQYPIFIG